MCVSSNIGRDPRWGRFQEIPGEDPLLNGDFGTLYTQGLQKGEDPRFVKVAVTLKHWDAYSLEDSDGFTRHNFNALVSNYALADSYFPGATRLCHGVCCARVSHSIGAVQRTLDERVCAFSCASVQEGGD
jgi:beta-glucosidase-like glycosyl hydrolase